MAQSDLGCAQNSDGSLRDASEIQFYNDVDDERPISGPSSSRPLTPIFTRELSRATPKSGMHSSKVFKTYRSGVTGARQPPLHTLFAWDTYFRLRWETEHFDKAMEHLETVFDEYYAAAPNNDDSPTANIVVDSLPLHRYGSSFLLNAVKSAQQSQKATAQPRDELKRYLSAPLETTSNILHWWDPTLLHMARDYLAIQSES
ncbi:hypothetical protein C8R44DRAFT_894208 [Mycena epipterygia]|nr:hypothetical protein C8R44DRAFT_894208 [Mycena epipterygia]